jgi:uncharacterized protein (TIGR03067 family)
LKEISQGGFINPHVQGCKTWFDRLHTRDKSDTPWSNDHMKKLMYVLAGCTILAAGCSTPHKSDQALLQGRWEGGTLQGDPHHQCSFVISGNNFEFHDETDTNVWYKGTFTLREDAQPRQYIATITECPFPQYVGKTSLAIYRLENSTLTIAGNEPGQTTAPAAFDAPDAAAMELKKK